MFTEMLSGINNEIVELIFKAQVQQEAPMMYRRAPRRDMKASHDSSTGMGFSGPPPAQEQKAGAPPQGRRMPVVADEKIGRNDPCPCGSGKKYKKCHGK